MLGGGGGGKIYIIVGGGDDCFQPYDDEDMSHTRMMYKQGGGSGAEV